MTALRGLSGPTNGRSTFCPGLCTGTWPWPHGEAGLPARSSPKPGRPSIALRHRPRRPRGRLEASPRPPGSRLLDDLRERRLSRGGDTPRSWFDRALAAQMDYGPAYTTLLYRSLPRSGGSYEQVLEIGKEAVGSGRFDTGVPLLLLDAVNQIAADQKDDEGGARGNAPCTTARKCPASWTRCSTSISPSLHAGSRSLPLYKVCVAGRSGRLREAREQLAALRFRLHPRAEWCLGEPARGFHHAGGGPRGTGGGRCDQGGSTSARGGTTRGLSEPSVVR